MKKKKKTTKKRKATKKNKKKKLAYTDPKDLPVTFEALESVRDELKSDIASVQLEVKALEKRMDARFEEMEARFERIDARFEEMEARFERIDARFEEMEARLSRMEALIAEMSSQIQKMGSAFHRMLALFEEQNVRNKASFEGAEFIKELYEDHSRRIEKLEAFQYDITKRLDLKTNE